MPYSDFLGFDKHWENSNDEIQNKAYALRKELYTKLKSYNTYLDKVQDFIKKYDEHIDEKLDKQVNRVKEADVKKFKHAHKSSGLGIGSGSYESTGILGLGIGIW